ncbi:MAG: Trm112 family protein [Deltaproteobacteria bacterium]|nr:Trm112 family protein [Deltaproteobacteria bacterium]
MPLPKDLLDIVACPKCKGKVTLAPDESEFTCARCALAYAIRDGLPNFLVDEARPLGKPV